MMEHGLVTRQVSLRAAIEAIDRSPFKIALVVDEARRLVGTVTDGDVRRALLAGRSIDTPVVEIMYRTPVLAHVDQPLAEAERLARVRSIRRIPIVDGMGRVVAVHTVPEINPVAGADNAVVLMAGGLGLRLRPLTDKAPKPLLAVGEKPLLETIVENLVIQGFHRIFVSVRYKREMVEKHFGDGQRWNAEISYLRETEPLGTAGALGLLPERPNLPMVVMNADLLTKVDLRCLLEFHSDTHAAATMGVRAYDLQIPYGVVTTEGDRIASIEEKPVMQIFVNAGIYALEPTALDLVTPGERIDMPDLFKALMARGQETAAFPVREYWIDVGKMEDYRRANEDYKDVFE